MFCASRGRAAIRKRRAPCVRRPALTLLSSVAVAALALPAATWARATSGDSASHLTAAPYAAARRSFEDAYARVEANLPDDSASDPAILKSYPLYPYLEAARIEQALGVTPTSSTLSTLASGVPFPAASATTSTTPVPPTSVAPNPPNPISPTPTDQRAAAFLAAHAGEPVTRDLRRGWLQSLAQRADWTLFLEAYDGGTAGATGATGAALRCQSFTARIAIGATAGLAPAIEKEWLTPHSLPECAGAFAWLKQAGQLTPALIEARAHLALANADPAFARQIIEQLPQGPVAASLLQWARLLEQPARSIDSLLASPGAAVEPAAMLAGWTLLARKHPRAAESRYWRLVAARGLTRETASPYALALALGLAWDRDRAAIRFYRRVAARDLDEPALEWRVRAALWSKDWRLAQSSIAALPPADRKTSRWRYWAARSAAALHDSARARRIYESLLADDDYYSGLAAARLRRYVTPEAKALPADPEALSVVARLPGMIRARELFLCGLEPDALLEWRLAYAALTREERLQSIRLAARWGWYEQSVETAATQRVFDDYTLLYPRPFGAEVEAAAERVQLTPDLVLGVMRQESLYRVDAVSPAGALGLMQLMPQTARSTASYWDLARPGATDLFIPAVNISLGAARLRMLLNRFAGRVPLALAGYNAGVNAVVRWLPARPVAGDVWIENIPYNETREYVERILWHSLLFTWLREGSPQRTRAWIAPVRRADDLGPLKSRARHTGRRDRRLSWQHVPAAPALPR